MSSQRLMRCTSVPAIIAVALGIGLLSATVSEAGIVLPEQFNFDASDLEQSASAGQAGTASPSASDLPTNEDEDPKQSVLLKVVLPSGSSSTSNSPTSTSRVAGSGGMLCVVNNTITVADDSSCGRLSEDHGLSLPDPPGIDLLRPPRHV
jgi:hypothetical protein